MRRDINTRFTTLIVAMLFCILPAPIRAGDQDADGIDDDYENQLAWDFRPHYIFHPREDYYYMAPENFIDRDGLLLNQLFQPFNNVKIFHSHPGNGWAVAFRALVRKAPPNVRFSEFIGNYSEDRIGYFDPQMYRALALSAVDGEMPWSELYLKRPQRSGGEAAYKIIDDMKLPFDPSAPVVHLVEMNVEGNMEVQYWAFSHADDKNLEGDGWLKLIDQDPDHLCDWSHVALVFPAEYRSESGGYVATGAPIYAYYSAHRNLYARPDADSPFNPRYLIWNDVHTDQEGHPIVLVSRNQHELYFENNRMPVAGTNNVFSTERLEYADGERMCCAAPYVIQNHIQVGNFYYDQVGNGVNFVPARMANIGNGSHPNPALPWVKFGGKWASGPTGPLGPGGVRFRQHNVRVSVPGDFGSVVATYGGLIDHGSDEWRMVSALCGRCQGGTPDFVNAVLRSQEFVATADAYEQGWGVR